MPRKMHKFFTASELAPLLAACIVLIVLLPNDDVPSSWRWGLGLPIIGCATIIAWVFVGRVARSRKLLRETAAAKLQLEALLDTMIAIVESPTAPLEEIIHDNATRKRRDGANTYTLHLYHEGCGYLLEATTDHRGCMQVKASSVDGNGAAAKTVISSTLAGISLSEPWFVTRFQKLRGLVGHISKLEARKQALRQHLQDRGYADPDGMMRFLFEPRLEDDPHR